VIVEGVSVLLFSQESPGFSFWAMYEKGPDFTISNQINAVESRAIDPVQVASAYASGY